MSDRVNRTSGPCRVCGLPVPRNGGVEWEAPPATERDMGEPFDVLTAHLACRVSGRSEVVGVRDFAGKLVGIVNRNGRCEDAPCCGCCGSVQ